MVIQVKNNTKVFDLELVIYMLTEWSSARKLQDMLECGGFPLLISDSILEKRSLRRAT
uniref:Uncharacterized protein n=1 Tax=Rhizophora mucronata TaxID=61149 RepID=A0A2P2MBQ8_RHIMU